MDSGTIPYLNTAVTGVLFLVLVYCYHMTSKRRAAKSKRAPEPAGGWPILGHHQLLAGSQLLHKTLGATADIYGPIFTVKLGLNPTLVVSSWELAKELFSTNNLAVSSRPPFTAAKYLGYNFVMFAFSPQSPYWRETRKIAISELLSNRRLNQLKDVRIHENDSGDVDVDLKEWFSGLTLNAILRTVAGKRYYGSAVADNDKIKAQQWQKAVRKFFEYLGMFVVRDALPFLGWLDIGGHEKAMKRTAKEMDIILEEWLEEHKRKRLLGEADQAEQDFMDVMLSVLPGADLAGYDADTVNKATCLLKRHYGYIQAAPLLIPRQFIEDRTIGGYHVPKGTRVLVNNWKIQRDSRIWPNPLEFKPERFLTTHKDVDWRRACPGISLGLHMVHLTLATFLQRFQISTPENAPVDMIESSGLTNLKATPLEVLLSPRLPPHLYA
ncbi:unnamed protein product, partial [Dovyalis caffra]